MTAIRHTATLTEWNGEQGIAQADSGTAYPVSRQQLYYAPYQIGSRIQIYVENGVVVDGGLIPIAGVDEDQQVRQQVIRGFNQSWIRLTVLMTFAVIVAGVVQTIVFWLFWNESDIKSIIKTMISNLSLFIGISLIGQRRQVTCTKNGIVGITSTQFLAWRDISHTEARRVPIFRLPYLLVHSKNNQPAMRINLFLLTPKQRDELQTLIQSHIQAA
nr:hypothetical protein [uncultured Kingella sp.]